MAFNKNQLSFLFNLPTILCVLFCALLGHRYMAYGNFEKYKVVTVKSGDSISYLSFKVYKKFNIEIQNEILKHNPKIKNINQIYVGQKIKFPRYRFIEANIDKAASKTIAPENEISNVDKTIKDSAHQSPESPIVMPSQPIKTSEKLITPKKMQPTKNLEKLPLVEEQYAYITYKKGEVKVKKAGNTQFHTVVINKQLSEGDVLRVETNSRAEIITFDGDVIRLSENTEITISKLKNYPQKRIQKKGYFLSLGRMWNKAKSLIHSKSEYTVRTPNAISGIRGTSYTVEVGTNNSTRFNTYSGIVKVWNPKNSNATTGPFRVQKPVPVSGPKPVSFGEWQSILLKLNQELTVSAKGIEKRDFDPAQKAQNDEWIKWNQDRDDAYDSSDTWY